MWKQIMEIWMDMALLLTFQKPNYKQKSHRQDKNRDR